jgi:cytochrome c oxidase cbb3-type subunit 1
MSSNPSLVESIKPTGEPAPDLRARLGEVDDSMRKPAMLFLVSAVFWLLAGTLLAIIAAIKSTNPDFLGLSEWMTFGRVRSAHLNAMIYGWGNNVIFAVAPWIMARLSKARIRHTNILLMAGIVWNLAVIIGILGIFKGDLVGVEWLEMPAYVAPIILISYALVGVWVVIAFRWRQSEHVYVSQWYILAAFFCLPWLYTVAQIMLVYEPATGVIQSLTNWWYSHNIIGLWMTPIAIGTAYYLIPKVLGRPIHSYYLSVVGFWTMILFFAFAGVHHLIGGPVPAWVISIGVVSSVMLIIPIVVTAINLHLTVVGAHKEGWASPTMRFVVFGAINFTAVGSIGAMMSLRHVNETTHFTHFTVGHAHHGLYAFFSMIMFGAVYYMMPRLLLREWRNPFLIKAHWYMSGMGALLMVAALMVGGWIQGMQMNAVNAEGAPVYEFLQVVENTKPWLWARSMGGLMIMVGHFAFAMNVFWMIFSPVETDKVTQPTLLTPTSDQA